MLFPTKTHYCQEWVSAKKCNTEEFRKYIFPLHHRHHQRNKQQEPRTLYEATRIPVFFQIRHTLHTSKTFRTALLHHHYYEKCIVDSKNTDVAIIVAKSL